MIITRTPFRISFLGGGTDYPVFYNEHGGAVISTTINKYCYITCRYLPPFFEHKHSIVYSKIERIKTIEDIQHPAFKGVLQFMNINDGVELHHDADLPAKSGLGSSSSFTVGLLHALRALKGEIVSKNKLAKEAIFVEREMLKENVGSQDQIAAAYGGLNLINFMENDKFNVTPLTLKRDIINSLESHILFFFTGFTRFATDIASEQVKETPKKVNDLLNMLELVDEGLKILNSDKNQIKEFGKLINETWKIKRSLTTKITNPEIDSIYDAAIKAGAYGGKLIGAGGGGFMMFIAPPEKHEQIKKRLKSLLFVPIKFDNTGSQVIFYNGE